MNENKVKKCLYCSEEISILAKKCRFCGEWLDDSGRKINAENNRIKPEKGKKFKVGCLIILAIIFILLMYTANSSNTSNNSENSNDINVTKTSESPLKESAKLKEGADNIDKNVEDELWAASVMGSVVPKMVTANDFFTNASNAGAKLDLVSAQEGYESALKKYEESKETLSKIEAPKNSNLVQANKDLDTAIGFYINACNIVLKGINALDADIISNGAKIYDNGTEHLEKATKSINLYDESIN